MRGSCVERRPRGAGRIEIPLTSPRTSPTARFALAASALVLTLTGCGTPGAPTPSASSTGSGTARSTTTPPAPSTTPATPASRTGAPGPSAASSSAGEHRAEDRTRDAAPGTALAALDEIPVKGRAPKTGYSRDEFGPRWADTDHNGCDTRNDVLRRDLTGIDVKPGTHGCTVAAGSLLSPYTGVATAFTAGQDTSSEVQIDHVVALSDAWQKGAQQLDAARRTELANDPLNLLAVDGPSNNRKSDGDAATWLPPATGERCEYVATQIAVKKNYELWVTDAEKNATVRVLEACPGQQLPRARQWPAPVDEPVDEPVAEVPAQPAAPAQPAPPAAPAPGAPPANAPSGDLYFSRCVDARAAGMAPLYAGSPGYRTGLDGDGDGVACEPRR
ncbi:GmrSD restriction endonuclease domain-containing protein [Kocuria rhizophila]|uniref:GmrSD restriction endonuclease domain-containing protein n=1 Tax=Kocuria rhizophila TaxID=72000 RepID=UPI002018EB40|nr:DUF1524 domain-containing protein [Kocuria rhizophila]